MPVLDYLRIIMATPVRGVPRAGKKMAASGRVRRLESGHSLRVEAPFDGGQPCP